MQHHKSVDILLNIEPKVSNANYQPPVFNTFLNSSENRRRLVTHLKKKFYFFKTIILGNCNKVEASLSSEDKAVLFKF